MAKEIKMDYEEYETMLNLIKTQNEVIEKFKKGSNVVLIDNRFGGFDSRLASLGVFIPRIVATDDLLAKEYLQEEFKYLERRLEDAEQRIKSYKDHIKELTAPKKSWWTRNSFDL
jgi:hypothetical protein